LGQCLSHWPISVLHSLIPWYRRQRSVLCHDSEQDNFIYPFPQNRLIAVHSSPIHV
jgi:hypothetical protein